MDEINDRNEYERIIKKYGNPPVFTRLWIHTAPYLIDSAGSMDRSPLNMDVVFDNSIPQIYKDVCHNFDVWILDAMKSCPDDAFLKKIDKSFSQNMLGFYHILSPDEKNKLLFYFESSYTDVIDRRHVSQLKSIITENVVDKLIIKLDCWCSRCVIYR